MSLIMNVCSVMSELTKQTEKSLNPKLFHAFNVLHDACTTSKATQAERDEALETWVVELYRQLRANNGTRVHEKEAEKLAREEATADSGITAVMSHLQDTLVDLRVIAPVYASEPTDLFNLTKAVKASFTVDLPDRPNSVIACTNWVKGLHDALLQPATVQTDQPDKISNEWCDTVRSEEFDQLVDRIAPRAEEKYTFSDGTPDDLATAVVYASRTISQFLKHAPSRDMVSAFLQLDKAYRTDESLDQLDALELWLLKLCESLLVYNDYHGDFGRSSFSERSAKAAMSDSRKGDYDGDYFPQPHYPMTDAPKRYYREEIKDPTSEDRYHQRVVSEVWSARDNRFSTECKGPDRNWRDADTKLLSDGVTTLGLILKRIEALEVRANRSEKVNIESVTTVDPLRKRIAMQEIRKASLLKSLTTNTVKTEDNDQRVSPQEIEKRLTALEVRLARCDRNESTVGLDESLEEDERSKLTEARLQAGVDRANTAQRKCVPQHEGFFSQPASTKETVLSVKIEPMAMAAQQEVMKPDVAEEGTQVVNATPSVTITFDDLFIMYCVQQQSAATSQMTMHRRRLDSMIVAYYTQATRELSIPADVEGCVTGMSQHCLKNIAISYSVGGGYKLLIGDDVVVHV